MGANRKTRKNRAAGRALGILLLLATSCMKEQPPELPPLGTLQSDLSALEAAPSEAKNADPAGVGPYTNFANAWVRVAVLRLYAGGVLLLPTLGMALALSQEPVLHGHTWVWTVTVGNTTGELELSGGSVAGWDVAFLVTNVAQNLDRFVWIEGHFAGDLSTGYWLGHAADLPAGADEVLEISWRYASDTDKTLEFSNVNAQSPDLGDVLSYTVLGSSATLVFEDASAPSSTAVTTIDTVTGAGAIQVPLYNGGQRACWDDAFLNTTCP